jgi:hypothetical protein
MFSKEEQDKIAFALRMGHDDAKQQAMEALQDGTYQSAAQGFDADLINAIGSVAAAVLFDCVVDSEMFRSCCKAYDIGACWAWKSVGEEPSLM